MYSPPPPYQPDVPNRFPGERRDPALVLVFSLLTCGFYYIYWLYKVSEETQRYLQEPDTAPSVEVLLCFATCGLYILYWDYKIARKIMRMQQSVGLPPVDNTILYLVLNLLGLGIVNALIEQGHLNEVWHRSAQAQAYGAGGGYGAGGYGR